MQKKQTRPKVVRLFSSLKTVNLDSNYRAWDLRKLRVHACYLGCTNPTSSLPLLSLILIPTKKKKNKNKKQQT